MIWRTYAINIHIKYAGNVNGEHQRPVANNVGHGYDGV